MSGRIPVKVGVHAVVLSGTLTVTIPVVIVEVSPTIYKLSETS
jgi:hypothetical protein